MKDSIFWPTKLVASLLLLLLIFPLEGRGAGRRNANQRQNPPVVNRQFADQVNYRVLQPMDHQVIDDLEMIKNDPLLAGQVEILWFFWYGCGTCRRAAPELEKFLSNLDNPDRVKVRKIPVAVGNWRPEAVDFFVFKQLNLPKNFSTLFYNAMYTKVQPGSGPEEVALWLNEEFQVPVEKSVPLFTAATTTAMIDESLVLTRHFNITATPSFVINRKYHSSARLVEVEKIADFLTEMVELVETQY